MIDARERATKNASDNGKPKARAGNGKSKAGNANRGRTRWSRRPNAGTNTTEKVEKVKKTAMGCQHDTPNFWHPASKEYSQPEWRRRNKTCRPSLRCSNCQEFV